MTGTLLSVLEFSVDYETANDNRSSDEKPTSDQPWIAGPYAFFNNLLCGLVDRPRTFRPHDDDTCSSGMVDKFCPHWCAHSTTQ